MNAKDQALGNYYYKKGHRSLFSKRIKAKYDDEALKKEVGEYGDKRTNSELNKKLQFIEESNKQQNPQTYLRFNLIMI